MSGDELEVDSNGMLSGVAFVTYSKGILLRAENPLGHYLGNKANANREWPSWFFVDKGIRPDSFGMMVLLLLLLHWQHCKIQQKDAEEKALKMGHATEKVAPRERKVSSKFYFKKGSMGKMCRNKAAMKECKKTTLHLQKYTADVG